MFYFYIIYAKSHKRLITSSSEDRLSGREENPGYSKGGAKYGVLVQKALVK